MKIATFIFSLRPNLQFLRFLVHGCCLKTLCVKWHICVCYTLVCKAQMLHLEIIDWTRQSNVSHLWLSFGRIYQFVMRRETDTSFSLNHGDAVISSWWHLRKFIESGLEEMGPDANPFMFLFSASLDLTKSYGNPSKSI